VAQGEPAQALQALPGVGPDLASAIIEIHDHGRCAQLDALEHELPEGLTQLLAFPGIGPKRVQQLREALQVDSLEDVLRAAQQGRIRSLRGFGAATERRIRDGILARMQPALRFAPHRVQAMAQALLPRLRSAPGVEQAVVAGSLRRMRDTIGDLDLLVGATQATAVMDRFVTGPEVMSVLSRGTTRASVMLHDGLQVDLRVVDPSSLARRGCTSPARRRTTSRCAAGRWRRGSSSTNTGCTAAPTPWPRAPKKRCTARSGCRGWRPSCARTTARSKPRWLAGCRSC